jgi:hypothetical protein
MIVKQPNQSNFTFQFEPKEWAVRNGAAVKEFLAELKKVIPADDREFDSTTNIWTVGRGYKEKVFEPLRKKYFVDEKQADLFGELEAV